MTLIRDFPTYAGIEFDGVYRLTYQRPIGRRGDHLILGISLEDTSGTTEVLVKRPLARQAKAARAGRPQIFHLKLCTCAGLAGDPSEGAISAEILGMREPQRSKLLPTPRDTSHQAIALRRVDQIMDTSLTCASLRGFLGDVFADDAFREAFLNASASRDYHHCERGGLVAHSIDVVERLAWVTHDEPDILQRQCALVVALLHDAGKLAPSLLGHRCFWMREHAHMNTALLEEPFLRLYRRDKEAWSTLHYLFGVVAGTVSPTRMPVAAILRALDHYSAGRDGKERAFRNEHGAERIASITPSTGGPRRVFLRSGERQEAGSRLGSTRSKHDGTNVLRLKGGPARNTSARVRLRSSSGA